MHLPVTLQKISLVIQATRKDIEIGMLRGLQDQLVVDVVSILPFAKSQE
jgi:hypothetical protein